MIRYLAIRNLAVIESVAVDFEQSFNILTGETGAGKSILVEAVGLLLGGRATSDLIRTGEDIATVEAIFESPEGGELIVRREITSQGRSRAFINGALATAAALKDLSNRLVEMHGQHEHQQLLDPTQHLALLDAWAGLDDTRARVASAFAAVRGLREQLDRLRMDDRERAARLDLVEFQLGELDKASLQPGEDETLAADRQLLRSADTIQRLCAESFADLYDTESAALATLARVWKRVGELAAIDPRFAPYLDARDGIKAQLEDLAFTLRDFSDGIDASPGRLQQVEDRLALLERLKRKHGGSLEAAIARRDRLKAEHDALTGGQSTVAEIEERLQDAGARFLDAARTLSAGRRAQSGRFSKMIESELAELAMARTKFEVRLSTGESDDHWTEAGIDAGEFFLSPNVGEDLRPLARIVSGGELSRVMLALKTLGARPALSGVEGIPEPGSRSPKTLIFDEVDAGIGGRVASVVGQKLAALGDRFQVLCITHLPQIASYGRTHFLIEKGVQGSRTVTSVTRLSAEARVAELARMMGGAAAGVKALESARELLDAAQAKGEAEAKAKGESPRRVKAKLKP
ncbi:MAG: DNA repair protein RecN [Acidobacteria bacterium RIFCSPLOWO2_12_FULL_67_14b]|nr:MAG: DNA repair protein RecN [Acidobacteria bacterium RIFCSPLOWO2_12_FULL_67_14b]